LSDLEIRGRPIQLGGMKHVDMRKLSAAAQEERRRQVIGLRESGLTYEAIAAQVGLTRTGVFNICRGFAEQGWAGLASRPRGPAPGKGRFLAPQQEAQIRAEISQHTTDELGLPFALWSRAAVRELIERHCGIRLAVRTMSTYLARWGFTAQKPLRRAYEQSPKAVRRWLRQDYPAIVVQARDEKGTIFWGDETGLCSDGVRGRSFAPRGRTPVVRPCHKRARLGLISAVTNRGELRWMVLDGALKAPSLIRFLGRLIQDASGKVFLIWDNMPDHRSQAVRGGLAEHTEQIEVFHLPCYSPELNPDEGLNADLKQAVTRKPPARSNHELKRTIISHMRRLTKLPERIRSYFRHQPFRVVQDHPSRINNSQPGRPDCRRGNYLSHALKAKRCLFIRNCVRGVSL
jgi:transposase